MSIRQTSKGRVVNSGLLLGAVVRLFADTVLGWRLRRMEIAVAPGGRGGAITFAEEGARCDRSGNDAREAVRQFHEHPAHGEEDRGDKRKDQR